MNRKKYLSIIAAITLIAFCGCNDFLDERPDNRTQLNDDNLAQLLTSGYSNRNPLVMTEMMSDNVDYFPEANMNSFALLQEEMWEWADIQEEGNESPKSQWEYCYRAIAVANTALEYIESHENPRKFDAHRGEALLIRALHHYLLVNVFCKHYSDITSGTDLGIPYMETRETTVNPQYARGTVAEVYQKINRDIEEGIPLIDDNLYSQPKFHFNQKAACAFAARFNLYYRKYDKAIEYANRVLGDNPASILRDMPFFLGFEQNMQPLANEYVKPQQNANLLLVTLMSQASQVMGNYTTGKKYMHSTLLSSQESYGSAAPWGTYSASSYYLRQFTYATGYAAVPRVPYMFEYTDRVAGIGYTRTVFPIFQSDETLLCRAEAYIMTQDYDNALKDMNLWVSRHTRNGTVLTLSSINTFYNGRAYYTPEVPTVKKYLNPDFAIADGDQENMLHCILQMRRILTIHEGLRWYDIKRYGIVIYRRMYNKANDLTVLDELTVNDPRRAIQLPATSIAAGMTPNPR
ncbi:MAG: RagB/SusD family nutrient uptake outer membrane protein [Bacteroidales bacterium]|nr:RagB/SusD family nutrient uptake outer membrane protein [Bacteroidales bacterium]MCL2132939.1 RagB/SusD family nutrient uptake outer membrane protein [Bacteroidales bacterium]